MRQRLERLTSEARAAVDAATARRAQRDLLRSQLSEREASLNLAREDHMLGQQSLRVLQAVSEAMRERMKTRLEEIATTVLRYVFDDSRYEVRIDVAVKHNLVHANVLVGHDGTFSKVDEGHGGGIADVLSYVFRTATLRAQEDSSQILVADEPFKFLNSQDATMRMAVLMKRLADAGLQQIIVSSKNDLADAPGRHFVFTRSDDGTVAEVSNVAE